jgi:V/A-type H+-transporting ATPase subunit C
MAMRSRLLTVDELREVTQQENVPAVVSYLKGKPAYSSILENIVPSEIHRGQVEPILRETVYRDFYKIYLFANQEQRRFLKLYFMRYEVYFLKECLARLFDQNHTPVDVAPFEKYFHRLSSLRFELLRAAESIDEFLGILKNTGYYAPLNHVRQFERKSLFDYEAVLDLYSFSCFWNAKDTITNSTDCRELTEILGSKFEMLNMQWIYRCKRYYQMSAAEIFSILIPLNYHISKSELTDMVNAEDLPTLLSRMKNSFYGHTFETIDPDRIEADYSAYMKKILKKGSRREPYSLATIYAYLYTKEHEVDELIIALECVRYNVAGSDAMRHLLVR